MRLRLLINIFTLFLFPSQKLISSHPHRHQVHMQPNQVYQQYVKYDQDYSHYPTDDKCSHHLGDHFLFSQIHSTIDQMRDKQTHMDEKGYDGNNEIDVVALSDAIVKPDTVVVEFLDTAEFVIIKNYRLHSLQCLLLLKQ